MTTKSDYFHHGLAKLKEEQTKGLWLCLEQISKWTKFREDYEQLKCKLETLPDKMDYDIMVPFGSVAFAPGKLIHTNEILVLLGDNWFTERSAKQASEIVTRRIAQCNNMLTQFEKEREQFEKWLLSTEKVQEEVGGDVLDIVEECDESELSVWREKHRQNVKKYHQNKEKTIPSDKGETEEEYWNRLEMSEAKNNEISDNESDESDISSTEEDETESEISSSDGESNQQTQTQKRKSVQWKDDAPESTSNVPTVKIKFTEKSDLSESTSQESRTPMTAPIIQSPSDIYKHFSAQYEPEPLKSILKSTTTPRVSVDLPVIPSLSDMDNTATLPNMSNETTNVAFSGVVVEREFVTSSQESKDNTGSTRRISKFKERQMKRK